MELRSSSPPSLLSPPSPPSSCGIPPQNPLGNIVYTPAELRLCVRPRVSRKKSPLAATFFSWHCCKSRQCPLHATSVPCEDWVPPCCSCGYRLEIVMRKNIFSFFSPFVRAGSAALPGMLKLPHRAKKFMELRSLSPPYHLFISVIQNVFFVKTNFIFSNV